MYNDKDFLDIMDEDELVDCIKQMRHDADSHADDDKKRRELAEAQNNGSRMVYETEKLLKEHADKLDDSSKSAIESSIEKVNTAIKETDVDAINTAINELTQASQALAAHLQQEQSGEPGEPAAEADESTATADEDVIDAEFEKKE